MKMNWNLLSNKWTKNCAIYNTHQYFYFSIKSTAPDNCPWDEMSWDKLLWNEKSMRWGLLGWEVVGWIILKIKCTQTSFANEVIKHIAFPHLFIL